MPILTDAAVAEMTPTPAEPSAPPTNGPIRIEMGITPGDGHFRINAVIVREDAQRADDTRRAAVAAAADELRKARDDFHTSGGGVAAARAADEVARVERDLAAADLAAAESLTEWQRCVRERQGVSEAAAAKRAAADLVADTRAELGVLRDASTAAAAAAQENLREILRTKLAGMTAAAADRVVAAKEELRRAVEGPFIEWLKAVWEHGGCEHAGHVIVNWKGAKKSELEAIVTGTGGYTPPGG